MISPPRVSAKSRPRGKKLETGWGKAGLHLAGWLSHKQGISPPDKPDL